MQLQKMKKTVLITGANKGIGYEIGRQLGVAGHQIILTGRNRSRIESATEKLKSEGAVVTPIVMDVSQKKSIKSAFQIIKEHFSHIDVLINNAGIVLNEKASLLTVSEENFREIIETNSFGPLFIIQLFKDLIPKNGRIINISSGVGEICKGVSTYTPVYALSKSMLNVMTMHLAISLKSYNISINAVCPGWVRTDMGGPSASRSVEKGAETVVWLATEADQKLTGKFFRDKKVISW